MKSHNQNNHQQKLVQAKGTSSLWRIGIGVLGFLIAISILIWISQEASSNEAKGKQQSNVQPNSQSAGSLSAGELSFDFGTVSMAQGVVKKEISLRASESGPVKISSIQTSCMCTSAILKRGDRTFGPFGMAGHGYVPPVNEELAAGEEAILEITFDPTAHGPSGVGRIDRVVTVESSGTARPIQINFGATVTP